MLAQHFEFVRPKITGVLKVSIRDGSGSFIGEACRLYLPVGCVRNAEQAAVPLTALQRDVPKREWYRLLPRDKSVEAEGQGSVRLKFKVASN